MRPDQVSCVRSSLTTQTGLTKEGLAALYAREYEGREAAQEKIEKKKTKSQRKKDVKRRRRRRRQRRSSGRAVVNRKERECGEE